MNALDLHSVRRKRPPKRFPRTQVMWLPSRFWQDYGAALNNRIIDKWREATMRIIIDRLSAIERLVAFERPGPMRTDAWPDEVSRQLIELSTEYDVIAKQSADIAAGTFQAVNGVSHRQWYAVAKRIMGVDLFSFEPWIESEMKIFVGINTDLITKIKSEVQSDVSRVVMGGFREGKRHETIAKELLSETDLGPGVFNKAATRAELVARDQTMKLYGDLAQKRQEGAGLKFYTFRTMEDERTRGNPSGKYPNAKQSHYCMDGKVCRWDDPTIYADTVEDAIAGKWKQRKTMPNGPGIELHPGQDIQCFPGLVNINFVGFYEKLFRRLYTGKTTTIIADGFKSFTATPNHPILTNSGWKAIDSIKKDDYVIKAVLDKPPFSLCNKNYFEASFEEIFNFWSVLLGYNFVGGNGSQFHNDGADEKVDVISFDSFLPNMGDIPFNKESIEFFLSVTDINTSGFLSGISDIDKMLNSLFLSPESIMRGFGKALSLLIWSIFPTDKHALASVSRIYSACNKPPSDVPAINFELFCKGFFAHPGLIKLTNRDVVEFFSVVSGVMSPLGSINSTNAEELAKIVGVDFKAGRRIPQGLSGHYDSFRVIDKIVGEFSGTHVYNLQTKCGYYNILPEGTVVKNCRCYASPVFETIFQ